ncbi:hypothetical protein C8Q73DRAFT_423281 [Cubamyces lactineus]|nr:hypothetical protein C8Q73DRAFT_423281 [Cubamyces lactineus]
MCRTPASCPGSGWGGCAPGPGSWNRASPPKLSPGLVLSPVRDGHWDVRGRRLGRWRWRWLRLRERRPAPLAHLVLFLGLELLALLLPRLSFFDSRLALGFSLLILPPGQRADQSFLLPLQVPKTKPKTLRLSMSPRPSCTRARAAPDLESDPPTVAAPWVQSRKRKLRLTSPRLSAAASNRHRPSGASGEHGSALTMGHRHRHCRRRRHRYRYSIVGLSGR